MLDMKQIITIPDSEYIQEKEQLADDSFQKQAVQELNQYYLAPSSPPFSQLELAQYMPPNSPL